MTIFGDQGDALTPDSLKVGVIVFSTSLSDAGVTAEMHPHPASEPQSGTLNPRAATLTCLARVAINRTFARMSCKLANFWEGHMSSNLADHEAQTFCSDHSGSRTRFRNKRCQTILGKQHYHQYVKREGTQPPKVCSNIARRRCYPLVFAAVHLSERAR